MLRSKPMDKKIAFGTAGLLLLAGALIAVWFAMRNTAAEDPVAEIRLEGALIRTVPLSEEAEFTVDCGDGYNTVTVSDGAISVTAADCPDKVCVKTGAISGGGAPIICLPHRLEIVVVNGSSDVDAEV